MAGDSRLDRLGPEDERILALERGPVVGHVCKVLIIDPPPEGPVLSVAALRGAISARIAFAARCTERIQVLPRGLGRPVWVQDSEFEIRHHVRTAPEAAGALSDGELRDLVAARMVQRLDRRRPLWALDVAPLDGDRTALIWRVHHCMADGMTALRLGGELLWSHDPSADLPQANPATPADPVAYGDLIAAAAADRMRAALGLARRAAAVAAERSRWRAAIDSAEQLPGTIRRELAPSVDASPFDAPVGTRRAVAWTAMSLSELHDAAKAVDPAVTVNDAVVSLVASGVSEWLRAAGRSLGSVRVRIPVSMHRPDEAADQGNRDSFMDVDVPLGGNAAERLRAVALQTAERKQHHDAEHLDRLFHEIGALPFGGHALAMTGGPHEFSLCVSNVPGPKEPIYVLGGRVSALYSVVEIAPRHALRASVLSASGVLTFALNANPEAVDPTAVVRGIDGARDELVAAAKPRRTTRRPRTARAPAAPNH